MGKGGKQKLDGSDERSLDQCDELNEEIVPSSHINLMDRPPYRPPDKGMRREGSDDYLKWPSKGGD